MQKQRYIWSSALCMLTLFSALQTAQPTGFGRIPAVLIEYIAQFNTTTAITDHEVVSWHEFMLINKQCWTASTQLMQKILHSLTNKEYELFKQTMHIYNLTQELAKKPKLSYEALRKQILDTHYPRFIQTNTGLYVTCGTYPLTLDTPWGAINLPQKDNRGASHVTEVLHTFLSRVVTTFYSVALPTRFYGEDVCYYLTNLDTCRVGDQRHAVAKHILSCDIPKYKGQRVLIEGNLCGYEPTLAICSIDGSPVETASQRRYDALRNRVLTQKIFTKLFTLYQQEQLLLRSSDSTPK